MAQMILVVKPGNYYLYRERTNQRLKLCRIIARCDGYVWFKNITTGSMPVKRFDDIQFAPICKDELHRRLGEQYLKEQHNGRVY